MFTEAQMAMAFSGLQDGQLRYRLRKARTAFRLFDNLDVDTDERVFWQTQERVLREVIAKRRADHKAIIERLSRQ